MPPEMVDAIGANAAAVRSAFGQPARVCWYGTGSLGIPWTDAQRALFPDSVMIEIDQGGLGSPVLTATVRDVESGAWAPGQATDRAGWNVGRPTIYCNRFTLGSVLTDGWQGDLWLAWPGWQGEPLPLAPGCKFVAVQNVFASFYDGSAVLDKSWPHAARKDADMINGTLSPFGYAFVPFPAGSMKTLMLYRNFESTTDIPKVRLEVHSASAGYRVYEVAITGNVPQDFPMPATDIDAVTLRNETDVAFIGYTFA